MAASYKAADGPASDANYRSLSSLYARCTELQFVDDRHLTTRHFRVLQPINHERNVRSLKIWLAMHLCSIFDHIRRIEGPLFKSAMFVSCVLYDE